MKEECQEIVDGLKEKIAKYEELLDSVVAKVKQLGTIVSIEYKIGDINFYRVDTGSSEAIFPSAPKSISTNQSMILEKGMEVMVQEDTIVDIVPKVLQKVIVEAKLSLVSWEEIGGLKDQVSMVRESVEIPLNNPALMEEYGLQPISGILLYGPPGCGKTLIAKAIAHTVLKSKGVSSDAFIHIKGGDVLDKYVGESEKIIAAIFNKSRKFTLKTGQRGVIFIDEAEALLTNRGFGGFASHSVVPSFLNEMDGMSDQKPLVILATNIHERLDPAVVRDGRIDLRLRIDRPNEEGFAEICAIHLKKALCKDNVKELSKITAEALFQSALAGNVTGSMSASVVKFAAKNSMTRYMESKGKKGITTVDVKSAVKTLIQQHA